MPSPLLCDSSDPVPPAGGEVAEGVPGQKHVRRASDEPRSQAANLAAGFQRYAPNENSPLSVAINSALTGVLICDATQPDTPIVFVTDTFCSITGYQREEILGRNCRFLQGRDTDPVIVAQMRAAQAARRPFRGTLLNYRKDGTSFWNGLTITPVFGEAGELTSFVGMQLDMTIRVQETEQLRRSEARLALAQRVAHLGSWEQTFTNESEPTAQSLVWSDETFRIFGHVPDPAANPWTLFESGVHPDDRAAVYAAYYEALRTHRGYRIEHRIVRPDGTERIVHEEADLILDQATGRVRQVVGTVQDITERRQAEDHRRAKEEAERANEAKSKFLSRLSHELRTPLNAILGFGQLLELSRLNEQDAQSVGHILKGGRHLLSLVDEVLDLTRVEAGELKLTITAVSFGKLARECAGLVAPMAQARGVICSVESCPTCQPPILASEQRLRQVLLNLLSNAIKYNRGGGRVSLGCAPAAGGRVRLSVSDTGVGISPEGLKRLFVPFERLDQVFGAVEGTGLGLVVSRRLVEAMDGHLGVESQLGQGSIFWIELPTAMSEVAVGEE